MYLRGWLKEQERMKHCSLYPLDFGECDGRLEWEHAWIYAGQQINEAWAIIAVCHKHHAMKDGNRAVKAAIQRISLNLASADDLAKYPRKNWAQERKACAVVFP